MSGIRAALDRDEMVRLLDAERYPLQYHALVVEVTSRCNAACAMCYQSAGPRGSDELGAATLDTEDLIRVLREARRIPAMDPRVHVTGGEAFLRVDPVVELIAEAARLGYRDIMTTTNATWARSPRRADEVCARLREAGLTGMAVSWDWWHQPYIRPEWVQNCLLACAENGIATHLRVLTSRTHGAAEALALLNEQVLDRVDRISGNPVLPIGRARHIDPAELFPTGSLSRSCHAMLSVTVNPWGNVFPCCSGFDQTDTHVIGNVLTEPLPEIVARMGSSPLVRVLTLGGIAKLYALIGEDILSDGRFRGICHACWSLFDDPDRVAAVSAKLSELVAGLYDGDGS